MISNIAWNHLICLFWLFLMNSRSVCCYTLDYQMMGKGGYGNKICQKVFISCMLMHETNQWNTNIWDSPPNFSTCRLECNTPKAMWHAMGCKLTWKEFKGGVKWWCIFVCWPTQNLLLNLWFSHLLPSLIKGLHARVGANERSIKGEEK